MSTPVPDQILVVLILLLLTIRTDPGTILLSGSRMKKHPQYKLQERTVSGHSVRSYIRLRILFSLVSL